MIEQNVGHLVAQSSLDQIDVSNDKKQTLKIVGFTEFEVSHAIQELEQVFEGLDRSIKIRVGGADDSGPIDSAYRLTAEETLTRARLATEDVVFLFEVARQSDASSSSHTARIDDTALVQQADSSARRRNLTRLLRITMRNAGLPDDLNIDVIQDGLIEISDVLSNQAASSKSLRIWAQFIQDLAQDLRSLPSPAQQRDILGNRLPALYLFRDPDLFDQHNRLETGRLKFNSYISQVRSASGNLLDTDREFTKIESFDPPPEILTRLNLSSFEVKQLMRDFILNKNEALYSQLELGLWIAYDKRTLSRSSPAPLGDVVRAEIDEYDGSRVAEFDDLDVQDGLNQGIRQAAVTFISAESESEDTPSLLDLLTPPTRRRVQRLAQPRDIPISDPLLELLTLVHDVGVETALEIRLSFDGADEEAQMSRWLFAFIYGRTLIRLMQETSDSTLVLQCSSALTDPRPEDLQDWLTSDDPDEEWWFPLKLEVQRGDESLVWSWDPRKRPELAALAASIMRLDSGAPISEMSLARLKDKFFDQDAWLPTVTEDETLSSELSELLELRHLHASRWQLGIEYVELSDYVLAWGRTIRSLRTRLVPDGTPISQLSLVTTMDTCEFDNGQIALQPTHPIYLRWFASHLARMSSEITQAMTHGLRLNSVNDEFYFLQLKEIQPSGTPPFLTNRDRAKCLSDSSEEPFPIYTPRGSADEGSALGLSPDLAASRVMLEQLGLYLESYPHKIDGLSVALFLHEGSATLVRELLHVMNEETDNRIRLKLFIFCPVADHTAMRREIDTFLQDSTDDTTHFLPRLQVIFRTWNLTDSPDFDDLVQSVDVALAPGIFTVSNIQLQERTEPDVTSPSMSYDPWIDPCFCSDDATNQINVSKRLLPLAGDEILESWSTLIVRSHLSHLIQRGAPENLDYVSLTIEFDRQQVLFRSLHEIAHWVVTVDRFIGREQVDAMHAGPDVIVLRPQIGINEAFTLMVSSTSGREFVVTRLAKRLTSVLPDKSQEALLQIATSVYSAATSVAPGSLLRALGLGNTANELVGLVVSRYLVESVLPISDQDRSFSVWLSLDDLQDWFGGASSSRADLARFTFVITATTGVVTLQVLVLESKFRKTYDGEDEARRQLDNSVKLLSEALDPEEPYADGFFWRRELVNAIEKTPTPINLDDVLPTAQLTGGADLSDRLRILSCLKTDNYQLGGVSGLFVGTGYDDLDTASEVRALANHQSIRVNQELYREILEAIHSKEDPRSFTARDLVVSLPSHSEGPCPKDNEVHGQGDENTKTNQDAGSHGQATADESAAVPASSQSAGGFQYGDQTHRGVGEQALRLKYVRLLAAIEEMNVQVEEVDDNPYSEGPGFFIFRVRAKVGTSAASVMRTAGQVGMRMELPQGEQVRTYDSLGHICFEVPKMTSERYWVSAESLWDRSPLEVEQLTVPLGEDISGDLVSVNFSSDNTPHLLIAGMTGSGKSVALETILYGLTRYSENQVKLGLIDPKGTELTPFEDMPHLERPIGMFAEDAIPLLETGVQEMERRYALFREHRVRGIREFNRCQAGYTLPWFVIVLDEYADLTSDPADKTAIESLFRRLAAKARASGIHLIAATQRPDANVISAVIRSNFPAQLALRTRDRTDSQIIIQESGAETLAGLGDALLRSNSGVTRLQIAQVASR